ncbi:MAG: hypothetical protein KBS85_02035, partial [Lachnospiraceae bacterium]|nr:hypothetical protein [Candidatus Merdinaster equi]
TTIAAIINAVMILVLAAGAKYKFLFHIRKNFSFEKKFLKLFFIKCFPIVCNEVFLGIANMIINITFGRQDESFIAAVAVFRTIEGLLIAFFMGFTSAASVLVGKCVGAGEIKLAYNRAIRLVYLCSGFILIVGSIIFAFHPLILHAMRLEGEAYRIGVVLLGSFMLIAVVRMGNWIHNDTFRAAGDAVFGTVLEIIFMYVMVIPLVLLTGFVWNSPYWVVFLCAFSDEPIRYIIIQKHLYSGKWIKPVTEEGRNALTVFRKEMMPK